MNFTDFRVSEDFTDALHKALGAWTEANKVSFKYHKCVLEDLSSEKVRILYRGIVTDYGIYDHYKDLEWVRGEDGTFQFTEGATGTLCACPARLYQKSATPSAA